MTSPPKSLRIFISSPGDVSEERDKARRVIDSLQRHYTGIHLQPVLWEDLALPATGSFQGTIDFILQNKTIDIAVFILWSRLGSPLGSAITRANGTPYRSGTEREFDVMLEAFEQSGRQRPVILAYTRMDESGFRQSLTNCPATGLEELIAQRKLAESFIREQFRDEEGHNLRAYHSYREPVSFAQRLHTHLHQVLNELLGDDVAPRWLTEPYRGLEVFDVEHAPIFQDREEETCNLLQRLRDQEQSGCAFTVIVGASGSGKSSLARAGVAAALSQHAYDDHVKAWRIVTLIPSLGGGDLNRSLARALAEQLPELRSSATALDDIASGLAKDAALTVKLSIVPAFTRAADAADGAVRILLLVDQLEELWTDRHEDTPIVSLAHEALLRRWDELSQWVAGNREHLRLRARAEQSQQRWSQQGTDPSLFLPSGLPLAEGQILLRDARPLLTAETASYIERSIEHREAESRRQRRVRTTALAMSVAAALIAILAAFWINSERSAAIKARNVAKTEAANAKTQEGIARLAKAKAESSADLLSRSIRSLFMPRLSPGIDLSPR